MKINFDARGYVFQEGVSSLRRSFQTAVSTLEFGIEEKRKELAAYMLSLDQGGEWIGEQEDGHTLWSQDQVFEMEIDQGQSGVEDLRKAYAIAAYHHWERSARKWTAFDQPGHHNLVAAVEADGISVDGRLLGLRDMVNLLKHDSETWAGKLRKTWPGILRDGPRILAGRIDWYQAVELTNDNIQEALDAVALSGPFTILGDREKFLAERMRADQR